MQGLQHLCAPACSQQGQAGQGHLLCLRCNALIRTAGSSDLLCLLEGGAQRARDLLKLQPAQGILGEG